MNFDMNKMLQEAQRMQAELQKAQEEAASEIVEASAGGGMVTVQGERSGRGGLDHDRPACDRSRRPGAARRPRACRGERGAALRRAG